MPKKSGRSVSKQPDVFTVYQVSTQSNYKPMRPNRRLFYILLSTIFAIISAILFIFAIVFILVIVNVELNGIEYKKLKDTEPNDWSYNVTECGRPFFIPSLVPDGFYQNSRIINGVEVNPNSFPWMVSLRQINSNQRILEHFCAGSIINDDTILTAGHCVDQEDFSFKEIAVITGLHDRNQDIEYKSQVYRVTQVFKPFDPSFIYEKDLALLKLDRKILMGKKVAPICMTTQEPNEYSSFVGKKFLTIGWGDTSGGYSLLLANKLQQTIRKVIDDSFKCTFSNTIIWKKNSTLCTVSEFNFLDQSVCMGDSGNKIILLFEGI